MEASQQTMEQIGKMEVQIENAIATVENRQRGGGAISIASAIPVSEQSEVKEDRVIFDTIDGKTNWRIDTRTERFDILTGPKVFREAPEDIRQDFIEWVRECAMASKKGKARPDKEIRPFWTWYTSPEIKLRREALKNGGQATLEAVG